MRLLRLFGKDVKSCLKGAGKNMLSSPVGTTKVFMSASPASVAILGVDAAFGCGKEIRQRRYLEREACNAFRGKNFKQLNKIGSIYQYRGHGNMRKMLNTCPRI